MGEEVRPVIITIQKENYSGRFPLELSLLAADGHNIISRKAEFIGPNARLLKEHDAQKAAIAPPLKNDTNQ
jgi:hypothetical protein